MKKEYRLLSGIFIMHLLTYTSLFAVEVVAAEMPDAVKVETSIDLPVEVKEENKEGEDCKSKKKTPDFSAYKLHVTAEQKEIITKIVTTVNNTSTGGLFFKQGELKALGKKLGDIGSLQFFGYVFSQKELKEAMQSIKNSPTKYNGFIGGMKPGFNREWESGQLANELPGFARFLKAPYAELEERADERDWFAFVDILIKS